MANDDESVFKATRAATGKAAASLATARKQVSAARKSFSGGVGFMSMGSLGDKLKKRRACAKPYKELQAALDAADSALSKAEAACATLATTTQG